MKRLLFFIVVFITTACLHAQTVTVNGLIYTLTGKGEASVAAQSTNISGYVPILDLIQGPDSVFYSVTRIQNGGFANCNEITAIVLPHTLMNIGDSAFMACTGLRDIYAEPKYAPAMENAATVFAAVSDSVCVHIYQGTVGYNTASGWPGTIIEDLGNEPEQPELISFVVDGFSYTVIGANEVEVAAQDKTISGSVNIPVIVQAPDSALYSVTKIRNAGFLACRQITALTLPSTITLIGDSAFIACAGLVDIYAEPLTAPHFTGSPDVVFEGVSDSLLVHIYKDAVGYNSANGWLGTIVKDMEDGSVDPDPEAPIIVNGLAYTILPNNEVSVAVEDRNIFGEVEIPDMVQGPDSTIYNVTRISSQGFVGCRAITTIALPHSITHIGDSAFMACTGLTDIYAEPKYAPILEGVAEVTFEGVPSSVRIHIYPGAVGYDSPKNGWPGTIIEDLGETEQSFVIDGITYEVAANGDLIIKTIVKEMVGKLSIPDTVVYKQKFYQVSTIANEAARNATAITSLYIPASVSLIGDYAFAGCSGLKTIESKNTDQIIVDSTVMTARSLSFADNETVVGVGKGAFSGCASLTSAQLPKAIAAIGEEAFSNCIQLAVVTIPESVQVIESRAFAGCSNLAHVYSNPVIAPVFGDNVFENVPETLVVHVIAGAEGYTDDENANKIPGQIVDDLTSVSLETVSSVSIFVRYGTLCIVTDKAEVVYVYTLSGSSYMFRLEEGLNELSLPQGFYIVRGVKVVL